MEGWEECKLENVADIKTGKLNSNASVKGGRFPFFTCSPTVYNIDSYSLDCEAVLLAGNNANGVFHVHYYKGKFNVYQRTYVITSNGLRLDNRFLFYSLKLKLNFFKNISVGTATRFLTLRILGELNILLPPLPEQKAITDVLSSLDDKIDLLHRQNKTLEAMAEAMFRQWFIEEADEDWEEVTLGDLCIRVGSGGTPSTRNRSYYHGEINWYSTKELKDSYLITSEKKITKLGLDNSSAKIFPRDTVLIAIYASPTVGRLGILHNESCFNQAACGLVADEKKSCFEFLFLYLKNKREELNLMASGSAQQNLNVGKIKNLPVRLMDETTLEKLKNSVKNIFIKLEKNVVQIYTLENLRDTLLPKLMSGDVRVKYD